jgi:hypothetical protein
MDTKSSPKSLLNTVLALLVIINIIGEVGNVVAWWVVPDIQLSLNGGTLTA